MQTIKTAIDFIEERLEEDLTLDRVAGAVGLSRYQLQRLFRACYGDNLKGFIRGRRLTRAAESLAETDERILEIALASGFESQEAFSRSFKAYFGCNPGQYRRHVALRKRPGLFKPDAGSLEHRRVGLSHEPDVAMLESSFCVAGTGAGIDFEDDAHVASVWNRLFTQLREIDPPVLQPDLPLCGVSWAAHPGIVLQDEQCLAYIAGCETEIRSHDAESLMRTRIPVGLYAIFTHRGPLSMIPETINFAWGSWLARSGFVKSDRPDLERLRFGDMAQDRPVMRYWLSIDRPDQ